MDRTLRASPTALAAPLLAALLAACGGGGSGTTPPPADPCTATGCTPCDGTLAIDSTDPADAARALGLCQGLTSVRWILPDGTAPTVADTNFALGYGLLPDFGPNVMPREGSRVLALSTGTARRPVDPGYQAPAGFSKGYASPIPTGFPVQAPACGAPSSGSGFDGVGLEWVVTVPEGAHKAALDYAFYSYDWPGFVCSPNDDVMLVLVSPAPAGSVSGDVALDSAGAPVSVSSPPADLPVCGCAGGPPCTKDGLADAAGPYTCTLGPAQLQGTGFGADSAPNFEDHAATGWRTATFPVTPGQPITVRLVIWDSGDALYDSTVLLDHFRWLAQ